MPKPDPELRYTIRESKVFKRYQRILRDIVSSLDIGKIKAETRMMHAGRKSRSLNIKKLNPKDLVEANLTDVSCRSRFVEIRVSLTDSVESLKKTVKAVKRHIFVEYSDNIPYKTRADKLMYFDRFFREAEDLLSELDHLVESLDFYVKDIDQAGFALKNAANMLEMIYTRERSI